MYREVLVVEGVHDRQKIESVLPGASCIVTGGTSLSDETVALVRAAAETRGVILFLDPDYPGRKITDLLVAAVPNAGIAFLPRNEAISRNGRKVGVEHASKDAIEKALASFRRIGEPRAGTVTIGDLAIRGLSGTPGAARRRECAASSLGLPPANAKTMVKWMNMLGLSAEALDG
jgi:ribonuclease M5